MEIFSSVLLLKSAQCCNHSNSFETAGRLYMLLGKMPVHFFKILIKMRITVYSYFIHHLEYFFRATCKLLSGAFNPDFSDKFQCGFAYDRLQFFVKIHSAHANFIAKHFHIKIWPRNVFFNRADNFFKQLFVQ